MPLTRLLVTICAALALLVACTAAPPTPTTPPPPTATILPAPTKPAELPKPAAEPTKPAAEPTKPGAAPATAPTAAPAATKPGGAAGSTPAPAVAGAKPAAAGGTRTWTMTDETEITLRIREQLANLPAPNVAELKTKAIAGQLVLAPDGKVVDGSKFTAKLETLTSDRAQRDRFVKANVLETARFPEAEYTPTELRGFANLLPTNGPYKGQMVGEMKVYGNVRPITFEVVGTVEGDTMKGTANAEMKITEFGMGLPRVAILLSIEDLVRMEIVYTARSG